MMTEAAKRSRREYYRQYREKNRDRIRQKTAELWERKAMEQKSTATDSKLKTENENIIDAERNMRTMYVNRITFDKQRNGGKRILEDVFFSTHKSKNRIYYRMSFSSEAVEKLLEESFFFSLSYDPDELRLYVIPSIEENGYKLSGIGNGRPRFSFLADKARVLEKYSGGYHLFYSDREEAWYIELEAKP